MNRQGTLFILLLFLLIVVGGVVLYQSLRAGNAKNSVTPGKCDQFTTTQDCEPISLATSTWKVFENTKYGYTISYPSESSVSTNNDYANDLREEKSVSFYIPGKFPLVGVDATLYPNYPLIDVPSNDLDLKSYAESLRTLQVNYPNPNYKDQKIGELEETTIGGRKAYQFTLDRGFTTQKKSGRGYSIPPGQTYMYTITENLKEQKITVYYYLGNPIAETMYQTFVFK